MSSSRRARTACRPGVDHGCIATEWHSLHAAPPDSKTGWYIATAAPLLGTPATAGVLASRARWPLARGGAAVGQEASGDACKAREPRACARRFLVHAEGRDLVGCAADRAG